MHVPRHAVSRGTVIRGIKHWTALTLAVFLVSPDGTASVRAAGNGAPEARYNLMAVFLYNFASFVDWPADPVLDKGPIVIGVLGRNPFQSAAAAIEKKTVNGRPIRFRTFAAVADLEPTHILFLDREAAGQLGAARRRLQGHAVLTVGETDDFTRQGGVVRFFEVAARETGAADRSLGLEINEKLAQELNLQIRSKLLRLATVVDYPPPASP